MKQNGGEGLSFGTPRSKSRLRVAYWRRSKVSVDRWKRTEEEVPKFFERAVGSQ
jgi:hypothetical protein